MLSPLPVIANRSGGTAKRLGGKLRSMLTLAFAAAGADAEVQLLEGRQVAAAVREAGTSERVIVAGGDGTAASAAQELAGSRTELGLLPLGTLNHLARDLQLPTDLDEAAAIGVSGAAKPVDVGEVNGRVFVNNASIGLYPYMVRLRDRLRDNGLPKWLASVPAAAAALGHLPRRHLTVDLGDGEREIVTPLLFVGNNAYSLERGAVGSRPSLQGGKLAVYAVADRGRLALLWFAFRTMLGRSERRLDFVTIGECTQLKLRSAGPIELALDGEIVDMQPPLEFRIRPGALKIVAP